MTNATTILTAILAFMTPTEKVEWVEIKSKDQWKVETEARVIESRPKATVITNFFIGGGNFTNTFSPVNPIRLNPALGLEKLPGVAATNFNTYAYRGVSGDFELITAPELIRIFVSTGDLCRTLGHRWKAGRESGPWLTYPIAIIESVDYVPPEFRHCEVCKIQQTKQPGDWK